MLLKRAGRRRGTIKHVRHVWADAAYKTGFVVWCKKKMSIHVEIVTLPKGQKGFQDSSATPALGQRENLLGDQRQP